MYNIIYSSAANSDLDNIQNYIAKDDPERARKFIVFIVNHIIQTLSAVPKSGEPDVYDSAKLPNCYHIGIKKKYRVHYSIYEEKQSVLIHRIVNGSMQKYPIN